MKQIFKRVTLGIALVFAVIILYLLLWPVKIDPAAWTPPEAPALIGFYAENDHLIRVLYCYERSDTGISSRYSFSLCCSLNDWRGLLP